MPHKTSIGLGLAALGRPEYINVSDGKTQDKSEASFKRNAFEVLNFAYKKGVRYFDTAPSYGRGEQFLKEWNDQQKFADVVLGTKWGYTYVAGWQLGHTGPHEIKEHSVSKLTEQWAFSKQMLPALEIYQIHSATFESGVLENKAVLEQLVKIKEETGLKIGITTSGPDQQEVLQKALETKINGMEVFDSFQSTFNFLEQGAFSILQKAKDQGKTIIIKEALANGRIFPNEKYPNYKSLYSKLNTLAEQYKTGIDAIALRYCMDKLQPTIVLSGASDKNQLEQNLKANTFTLSTEDIALLDAEKVSSTDYWEERNQLNWD